jgi:hypothetical protein
MLAIDTTWRTHSCERQKFRNDVLLRQRNHIQRVSSQRMMDLRSDRQRHLSGTSATHSGGGRDVLLAIDTTWRTHSCVPRSHSCERQEFRNDVLLLLRQRNHIQRVSSQRMMDLRGHRQRHLSGTSATHSGGGRDVLLAIDTTLILDSPKCGLARCVDADGRFGQARPFQGAPRATSSSGSRACPGPPYRRN